MCKRISLAAVISVALLIGVAANQKVSPPPNYSLSDKQYQQLVQLQQAEVNWRVALDLITELTPDKDAPCDKRIREQVNTRHQLALSTGATFLLGLRSDLNVPRDYVLADDGKSFRPPTPPKP